MKIIVNRGFDKLFARIVIGKDAQKQSVAQLNRIIMIWTQRKVNRLLLN